MLSGSDKQTLTDIARKLLNVQETKQATDAASLVQGSNVNAVKSGEILTHIASFFKKGIINKVQHDTCVVNSLHHYFD